MKFAFLKTCKHIKPLACQNRSPPSLQLLKSKDKIQEPGEIAKIQLPNCKTWLIFQHFTNVQLLLKLRDYFSYCDSVFSCSSLPLSCRNIQVMTLQWPYCICYEPGHVTAQAQVLQKWPPDYSATPFKS